MDASERLGDRIVLNRRRQFGPMLLSRWPIIWTRSIVFPKLGTMDSFNMDTGAIEGVVAAPSGALRVYSLHLSALSTRERLMQIDQLLELHRNASNRAAAWSGDGVYTDPVEAENFLQMDWSNGEPQSPMPGIPPVRFFSAAMWSMTQWMRRCERGPATALLLT